MLTTEQREALEQLNDKQRRVAEAHAVMYYLYKAFRAGGLTYAEYVAASKTLEVITDIHWSLA